MNKSQVLPQSKRLVILVIPPARSRNMVLIDKDCMGIATAVISSICVA